MQCQPYAAWPSWHKNAADLFDRTEDSVRLASPIIDRPSPEAEPPLVTVAS